MTMTRLFWGAAAGLVATLPMTWAMNHMHRHLPREEQYPLPPVEIVDSLLDQWGLKPKVSPGQEKLMIVLGHYSYGAVSGLAYAALTPADTRRPVARGSVFGLLLWAASYLGWLPLLHILRPATYHPRERNALMLATHALWGAITALLVSGRR